MEGKVTQGTLKKTTPILLDGGAEANLIDQTFAVAMGLTMVPSELPIVGFPNGMEPYCYGAYEIALTIKDSWNHTRTFTDIFYAIDKDVDVANVTLGLPGLVKENIVMCYGDKTWRHSVTHKTLELMNPDDLIKEASEGAVIYAVVARPIPTETSVTRIGAAMASHMLDAEGPTEVPSEYKEFEDVFSDEQARELPEHGPDDHVIDTGDKEPPFGPLYNLSAIELKTLREYLDDLLSKGWIQPSISPAGAPVLFTPKKDGALRLCVDYRGLNRITRKNRHPLPLISQVLDVVAGSQFFTKLDLRDAYHRIRINKGDEWKTAFRTRYGHFEYLVMPFGLTNAPATFQAHVNKALRGLVDITCVVYLDDILIFSKDRETHIRDVTAVLRRLRKFRLYAKLKKCLFFAHAVEYLGFIVSRDGVAMDPRRVDTIRDWPVPQSFKDIQIFLGFANFYRRFIYEYSRITLPLTNMLKGMEKGVKKGPFHWGEDAAQAFNRLRAAFEEAPVLVHFDPQLRTRVETDASAYALAGIISQLQANGQWHPVAFYSRKMIPAERNYETHDQELLAIVDCFKHWRHYLEGSSEPVEVLTDHNNLKGFMNVQVLSGRQARWAMRLASFDFVISHRPGKTNPADAPSRRPDYYEGENIELQRLLPTLQRKLQMIGSLRVVSTSKCHAICAAIRHRPNSSISTGDETLGLEDETCESTELSIKGQSGMSGCEQYVPRYYAAAIAADETAFGENSASMLDLIKALQAKDPWVAERRRKLEEPTQHRRGRPITQAWSLDTEGILRHSGRVYVPPEASVRAELLRRHHDDELAGHFGAEKTLELLARKYHWPGINTYVKSYVDTCEVCQRTKAPRHRPYGSLQSLPQPDGPWKEITMDFITGLPPSKHNGHVYDACLVVVDRYTKMVLYIPVTKKINAIDLAEILFEKIVLVFGAPNGIVSDRGSVFTSAYWSAICFHLKTKRRLSTAFHPQTDGQTERQNQTLEHYLRVYCCDEQSNWVQLLPLAQFAYQNSTHSALGCSPFFAMYGYNPELRYNVGDNIAQERVPAAKERVKQVHSVRDTLARRWQSIADSTSKYYNKKHLAKDFNEGDLVMLSTKNLKLKKPSKKLSDKFIGPFRILEPVGAQAYRLALPETFKIHPVFHVSYLEPYKQRPGDDAIPTPPLPDLIDNQLEWEVEEILGKRFSEGEIYYKVRWTGYPDEYIEWIPESWMGNAKELRQEYEDEEQAKRQSRAKGQAKKSY